MKKLNDLKGAKVLNRSELKTVSGGWVGVYCRKGGGSATSSTASISEAHAMGAANCTGGYYIISF